MPQRASRPRLLAAAAILVPTIAAVITMLPPAPRVAAAPASGTPQRLSWQAFATDAARVDAFRRGVAAMKARDSAPRSSAEYRRSWEFWAGAHSYYGSPQSGSIRLYKADTPRPLLHFYDGLSDATAPADPAGIGKQVWDGCRHGQMDFFAWHRLYIHYFERVLADAAGDPALRLPYWDYTDPAHLQLPDAFRQRIVDGRANPLFDEKRTSQTVVLDGAQTDVDAPLAEGHFPTMQGAIEGGAHGHVHCALGNDCTTPLMGQVPASARDPLFWLHHANLDRLWECWRKRGGRETEGTWQDTAYFFVDATGALVSEKARTVIEDTTAKYAPYDKVDSCGRTELPPLQQPPPPTTDLPVITLTKADGVRVREVRTVVALSAPASDVPQNVLRDALGSGSKRVVDVVLQNITATRPPGAALRVYVESTTGSRRQFVGAVNFFGLKPGTDARGSLGSRRFPLTKALRDLGVTTAAEFRVVVEAGRTGQLDAASPSAGDLQDAGIEIGRVQVELRTASL